MLIHLWEFVVRLSPHFCPRVASELRFWLLHIAECRWKFDQEVVFVSTYIYINEVSEDVLVYFDEKPQNAKYCYSIFSGRRQ